MTEKTKNDPKWLEKEKQLMKCDKCRSRRKAADEKARRRTLLIAVLAEAREKKREHYVNLYRLVHDSNEGLRSSDIAAMSEEELDLQIATLSRKAREMGRKV